MGMELDVAQPLLLAPDEGETTTDRPERTLRILCELEQLIVTWFRYEPGEEGPDPHIHRQHTDAFYVLEGEADFGRGAESTRSTGVPATVAGAPRTGPRSFSAAPPGPRHGFSNHGPADSRVLNFHAPDARFVGRLRS